MHDAPIALEQGADDAVRVRCGAGVGLGDQRAHVVAVEGASCGQQRDHGGRFLARAGQPRVALGLGHGRLADHQHIAVEPGVAHALAEAHRAQLAQELGADRPRQPFLAAVATVARGLVVQQLPRDAGGAAIDLDAHFGGAAEKRVHLHRHQQLVERAADLRVLVAVAAGAFYDLAHQLGLRGLRADLGAGAPRVERIRDRAVEAAAFAVRLHAGRADQVVVGAAVAGVERAA